MAGAGGVRAQSNGRDTAASSRSLLRRRTASVLYGILHILHMQKSLPLNASAFTKRGRGRQEVVFRASEAVEKSSLLHRMAE